MSTAHHPTDNSLNIERDDINQDALKQQPSPCLHTISPGHIQGNTSRPGRAVQVQSIFGIGPNSVILTCDGGNCRFHHNMTPAEARELAGYLQAEANYCEQHGKGIDWAAGEAA